MKYVINIERRGRGPHRGPGRGAARGGLGNPGSTLKRLPRLAAVATGLDEFRCQLRKL